MNKLFQLCLTDTILFQ